MRATVVLPVPGLPEKLICKVGDSLTKPSFSLALSTKSNEAVSLIRVFTGVRPIKLLSSSAEYQQRHLPGNLPLNLPQ